MTPTFDTSGYIALPTTIIGGDLPCPLVWDNLTEFAQGFVAVSLETLQRRLLRQGRRVKLAFSDLSAEAIALIFTDCAKVNGADDAAWLNADAGRDFWIGRQLGGFANAGFPPLNIYLDEEGKVRFSVEP